MPQATFDGVPSRSGVAGDPVVFLDAEQQARFHQWVDTNRIFTKILHHKHPGTGVPCPSVYVSKTVAEPFQDGDRVKITIDVRPEARGNGIKVMRGV